MPGKVVPKSSDVSSAVESEGTNVKFNSNGAAREEHRLDERSNSQQNFGDIAEFLKIPSQVNGTWYFGKRQLKLEFRCGCIGF